MQIEPYHIHLQLVYKLILDQFPQYARLKISPVEQQGHDNRTFRLGDNMLIRMPIAEPYALKVPQEQTLLPCLQPYLTIPIPKPIAMGHPSSDYPYPFSIYQWLEGTSANQLQIEGNVLELLATELAHFLKELQSIDQEGPAPGQHNWWRGDHIRVYDIGARQQIEQLSHLIDKNKALKLWEAACKTQWSQKPVWVHGDFASGNILVKENQLSAIIDFGGMAVGDPACDLVIAWTFLDEKSRQVFKEILSLDNDTWLRAKAWALWKATYELCQIQDKNSVGALKQKKIINEVME